MRTVGAGGHVVGHVVSRVRGGFRHDGVVVSRPPCSVGFAVMGVSLFAVASLSLIRESLPTRWRILATFSFRIESSTMTTKCSASLAANGGVVTSRALSLAALGVANFRRRVNLFAWWRILATFSSRMCIRDARSHVRSYVHSHVHSHAHSRRAFSFWIALFSPGRWHHATMWCDQGGSRICSRNPIRSLQRPSGVVRIYETLCFSRLRIITCEHAARLPRMATYNHIKSSLEPCDTRAKKRRLRKRFVLGRFDDIDYRQNVRMT